MVQRILVVRNDKLGDLMLAYPAFRVLKQSLPHATVHALVAGYTREMAECCDGVDEVVIDPGAGAALSDQYALLQRLRRERYDAVVTLFSTGRIAWLTLLAGIPYRLAPATKAAQALYNRRLVQRRSRSAKPEHEYNLELAVKLLTDIGANPVLPARPHLHFPDAEVAGLSTQFRNRHNIPEGDRLIFIHPGSGGSANNLALEQYATLARGLRSPRPFTLVLTAGPGEEPNAARLAELLGGLRHAVYYSSQGLRRFAQHIQLADLFISGSTGPLHIAGALNRPTAAFYTRRRSATSLRWQTMNTPARRLAFSPPESASEEDMRAVDVEFAAAAINRTFLEP